MYKLRSSDKRGTTKNSWLNSKHTFSFADYYDINNMGFSDLRVINDDIVAPGQGFGLHPHSNMEIISIVLEGVLEHKDSIGNVSVIKKEKSKKCRQEQEFFTVNITRQKLIPYTFYKYG